MYTIGATCISRISDRNARRASAPRPLRVHRASVIRSIRMRPLSSRTCWSMVRSEPRYEAGDGAGAADDLCRPSMNILQEQARPGKQAVAGPLKAFPCKYPYSGAERPCMPVLRHAHVSPYNVVSQQEGIQMFGIIFSFVASQILYFALHPGKRQFPEASFRAGRDRSIRGDEERRHGGAG